MSEPAGEDAGPRRSGSIPTGPVNPGQVLLAIALVFLLGLVVGFVLGRTL